MRRHPPIARNISRQRPVRQHVLARGTAGLAAAAAAIALGAGSAAAGEVRFEDRAGALGVAHVYDGGWEFFVGGGVAVFDCNGDLRPDLFAAGGANPPALLVNASEPGGPLKFTSAAPPPAAGGDVTGAYPLDIDGDGRTDLAVLRVGENRLLRGLGDCRFEDAGAEWSFTDEVRWTTAFSATWEPGADWPTLAFGNYVDRTDPTGPFGACDVNMLLRPEGHGFAPPAPLAPGHCALSMLFSDWARRGRADLRVSNDRHYYVRDGEEQLWRLDSEPRLYGEAEGWHTLRIWGMGIASRDITGDGMPEVFLTSMADQKLQVHEGARGAASFTDGAYVRGMTAHMPYTGGDGRPSSGWHAQFGDVDNDGLDDLFIAKGNVEQMGDAAMLDPDNLLHQKPDGTFAEIGLEAGVASLERGRGAALTDLNLDGRLDLVVVNRHAPMRIYENVSTTGGNWIELRLAEAGGNRNAIGAWIDLDAGGRRASHEITVGGGHAGGQLGFEHFGLGAATSATATVTWPDGAHSTFGPLEANAFYTLDRSAGAIAIDLE